MGKELSDAKVLNFFENGYIMAVKSPDTTPFSQNNGGTKPCQFKLGWPLFTEMMNGLTGEKTSY